MHSRMNKLTTMTSTQPSTSLCHALFARTFPMFHTMSGYVYATSVHILDGWGGDPASRKRPR